MWQSKTIAGIALSALAISTQAFARGSHHRDDGYYVNAKVVRVEPILRVVRVAAPREVCWSEQVRHVDDGRRDHHNPVPMIVGGVVGGVVGNQIGSRGKRDALTIAGTLLGAAVGHSISRESRHHYPRSRSYTTIERHCETQTEYHQEERLDGYHVTYRYHGHHFTTRTRHRPGKRIRVWVQVEPTHDDEHLTNPGLGYRSPDHTCGSDCFDT